MLLSRQLSAMLSVSQAISCLIELTQEEFDGLRSQSVISKPEGRGGRRYLPYAFTEQGVAMLSSVLHSERAVHVNIEIMRAFVRLRHILSSNVELAHKLHALEKKYDAQFKVVFDDKSWRSTSRTKPFNRMTVHFQSVIQRQGLW